MNISRELSVLGFQITEMVVRVRQLDPDQIEQLINLMEMKRGTAPSPEFEELNEQMLSLSRLALQWRIQLGEQARTPEEMTPVYLRAMATIIERKERA